MSKHLTKVAIIVASSRRNGNTVSICTQLGMALDAPILNLLDYNISQPKGENKKIFYHFE